MPPQEAHRLAILREMFVGAVPIAETIDLQSAVDRCTVEDVRQIRWELGEAGVRVTPDTLLAMALGRSIVKQLSRCYDSKTHARVVPIHVTSSGDKGKH